MDEFGEFDATVFDLSPLPLWDSDDTTAATTSLLPPVYISMAQRWQAAAHCIEADSRAQGITFPPDYLCVVRDWTVLSRSSLPTTAKPEAPVVALPVLHLPLTLYFKWYFTGTDHEHHPVEATLLWLSALEAIHQIKPHDSFPEHFNGATFPNLSISAMHLKPIDQNGYESWFLQVPGTAQPTYISMAEARKQFQFHNTLAVKPPVPKSVLSKPALLQMPMCCTVPDPRFQRQSTQRPKTQRRQREPAPPTPLSESVSNFLVEHVCHLLLIYLSEVFPGLPENIQVSTTAEPVSWVRLSQASPHTSLPVFWQLGLWFLSQGGTAFRMSYRDVGDWSKYLKARCRPQCQTLALEHWCQPPPVDGKYLTFAPFVFTADTFTCRGQTCSLQRILEDVAFVRHVHYTSVMRTVVSDCPTVYFQDL